MIPLIIVGAIVLILIIYVISAYNRLVKQRITVEEAFSTMDVYLKKRFDMIPNLVETVKGYAAHEKDTLTQLTELRSKPYESMSDDEKLATSSKLSAAITKVMALAENYPDLKANQNFLQLSSQIQSMENDIANSRKYYNGAVKQYNTSIQAFPSNIIAGMFNFQNKTMFQVESEEERQNVKVQF